MISIYNLNKYFQVFQALKSISVDFEQGKVYALIGPNGSGKTTLIKCISGLVIPTSGRILLDNEDIIGTWKYRQKIGYMPQIGKYPDNLTIGQLFSMMKDIRSGDALMDESLYYGFRLDKLSEKRMHTLSGGTRQKVSAALAFLFNPPVLILDEPTAGLDPIASEILKEKISHEKQNGKLIIITSHIMNDLDELSTDMLYLYEGRLVYKNSIAAIKGETGEDRLGRAVMKMLINQNNEV